MSLGYLFKKFRILRGLTQKSLGEKTKLDDVRIRQYESDLRSPKDDVLEDICNALDVKPEYIKDPTIPYTYEEIIRLLFKLEDFIPMATGLVDVNGNKVHSIVFLGHNILKIDQVLKSWTEMQFKFMDEEISLEEYEDWKANWPDSMSENYKFNKKNKKQTYYSEYIKKVQKYDNVQAKTELKGDLLGEHTLNLFKK